MPGQMQGVVKVQSDVELKDAELTLRPSPGLVVDPRSIKLGTFTGETRETFYVSTGTPNAGGQSVFVEVTGTDPNGKKVRETFLREFTLDEISGRRYLLFAVVGIIVGYLVRFAILLLKASGPPPLDEVTAASGRVPTWWDKLKLRAHRWYYVIDCGVTVVLGTVILYQAMQGGHRPPQTGASYEGALVMGVVLGVLTNSELITRFKH